MATKIALAGNPNAGKTTLFNLLTGSNQYVGNWPGVTVEKKEGKLKSAIDVTVTDLPGIYSLSPYTLEEVVARNFLLDDRPDVILNIVDGTNLERNLFLTTQLLEVGLPVVVAINMMDVVKKSGAHINTAELSRQLNCPVVEISALKGSGIDDAVAVALSTAQTASFVPTHNFSGTVEHALAHIEEAAVHHLPLSFQRWYSIKIFERDKDTLAKLDLDPLIVSHMETDIVAVEKYFAEDAETIITNERYIYIAALLKCCYSKKNVSALSISDKIDRVITNKWASIPIFGAIMFLVYFVAVSTLGNFFTTWMADGLFGDGFRFFGLDAEGIPAVLTRGLVALNLPLWLISLIVDGIVGGVGAVLSFVPQMFILFLLLAFLEACGYMSRVAFVFDRVFRKFGMSGKSFVPMLIGIGCSVPAIMATRTIENERDRRITIMTTSFMPCGAKLPVIGLIAAALFGGAWWVAPSAYFIGMAAIAVSGIMLKKTSFLGGEPAPFVMELPAYHMPAFKNLMHTTLERTWSFIKKAGTLILLASIVIWATSVFGVVDGKATFDINMNLEDSFIGYIGRGISWLFVPLGFGTIESSIATTMGLIAKEEIVGVFGVLNITRMTPLAGYSFLVFNLLCMPCIAAVGAIRKEMQSKKWFWFAILYQTVFAYAISLIIFQIGSAFSGKVNVVGLIFALLTLAAIVFLLVRPNKMKRKYAAQGVI
jgi:ferrous iron transport protein B